MQLAGTGDEVVLAPGRYSVGALTLSAAVDLHGPATGPRAVVAAYGAGAAVHVAAAAHVHDLDLDTGGSGMGLFLVSGGALVERVRVTNTRTGGAACSALASATLRDTVCWAPEGAGFGTNVSGLTGSVVLRLRNVTAVGGRQGISYDAGGSAHVEVDAVDVVARGGTHDVLAASSQTATVEVHLSHSSFATRQTVVVDTGAATVTAPGTAGNQSVAPLWVDGARGDFRQAPGSPAARARRLGGRLSRCPGHRCRRAGPGGRLQPGPARRPHHPARHHRPCRPRDATGHRSAAASPRHRSSDHGPRALHRRARGALRVLRGRRCTPGPRLAPHAARASGAARPHRPRGGRDRARGPGAPDPALPGQAAWGR